MCLERGGLIRRGWEPPPTVRPTKGPLGQRPMPTRTGGKMGPSGWGAGRAVRLHVPHGSFSRMGWGSVQGGRWRLKK